MSQPPHLHVCSPAWQGAWDERTSNSGQRAPIVFNPVACTCCGLADVQVCLDLHLVTYRQLGPPAPGRSKVHVIDHLLLLPPLCAAHEAPAVSWTQVVRQEELGTARVCAAALVEGRSAAGQPMEAAGRACFVPPAPLMHPVSNIRLALAEAQHMQQQVQPGSCAYRQLGCVVSCVCCMDGGQCMLHSWECILVLPSCRGL